MDWILIAFSVVITVIAGVLYRLGGIGFPWDTKHRDFGVALVSLLMLYLWGVRVEEWVWLACLLPMFGALTTYYKGSAPDVKWYHWMIVGFMNGIAPLAYAWISGNWLGYGIRVGFLTIVVMITSQMIDDVEYEERVRGWLITGSMPLLLIGG